MSGITAAGDVPATIFENTPTNAWAALLTLQGSLTGLREVALSGADANRFHAVLLPGNQVRITPAMVFDREAFGAADPVFAFSLSARFDSGWVAVQGQWFVTLLDVDDTPPDDLRFATGGSVRETEVGGVIGTLAATDPDSPPGNITFSLGWPEEAWFEIVDGNVLKLRDGVDLLREGGTTREIVVIVSDGINTAARTVSFQVLNETDEDDLPAPPPIEPPPEEPPPPPPPPPEEPPPPPPGDENRPPDPLQPGETKHGFSFLGPGAVGTLRFSWEAELVLTGPDGLTLIRMQDGTDVWLPPINLLRTGDGELHFNPAGAVGQVIRVYQAVLDRPPDLDGLLFHTGRIANGATLVEIAESFVFSPEFLTRFGGLTNEQLVTALYQVALGRAPDPGGFAFHVGQLNAGMSRGEKIAQFVASPEAASIFGAANPGGVFVPNPHAARIAAAYDAVFDRAPDPGGLAFWSGLLSGGQATNRDLIAAITQSAEFQARHSGSSNTQFVISIFDSALERLPGPGGLAYWSGLLDTGALDRIDIVLQIGLSPEALSHFGPPAGPAFDLFG
ncbi:MAG: DUF4214 domain-containing protein [Acetobacteraceae bacterium]